MSIPLPVIKAKPPENLKELRPLLPDVSDVDFRRLRVEDVFRRGNQKLGFARTLTWSIPAYSTCPGKSTLCAKECYAMDGFYVFDSTKQALRRKLALALHPEFERTAIRLLRSADASLFRLHVSGDFFSVEYIQMWLRIVNSVPRTRSWAFTRSWRVPKLRAALETFAKEATNTRLFYSYDRETGYPEGKPRNVWTAYMKLDKDDVPAKLPDLFFRDEKNRKEVEKFIKGRFVCPIENGATGMNRTNCEKCQVCFRAKKTPRRPARLR